MGNDPGSLYERTDIHARWKNDPHVQVFPDPLIDINTVEQGYYEGVVVRFLAYCFNSGIQVVALHAHKVQIGLGDIADIVRGQGWLAYQPLCLRGVQDQAVFVDLL